MHCVGRIEDLERAAVAVVGLMVAIAIVLYKVSNATLVQSKAAVGSACIEQKL